MPKMRTRKTAAKRFKVSAGGKLLRRKTGMGKGREKKREARKRRLRQPGSVFPGETKKVFALLPYSSQ